MVHFMYPHKSHSGRRVATHPLKHSRLAVTDMEYHFLKGPRRVCNHITFQTLCSIKHLPNHFRSLRYRVSNHSTVQKTHNMQKTTTNHFLNRQRRVYTHNTFLFHRCLEAKAWRQKRQILGPFRTDREL